MIDRGDGQGRAGDEEPHDSCVVPRGVPPGDRSPEHPSQNAVAERRRHRFGTGRTVDLVADVGHVGRTGRFVAVDVGAGVDERVTRHGVGTVGAGVGVRLAETFVEPRGEVVGLAVGPLVRAAGIAEVVTHSRLPSQFGHSDKLAVTSPVTVAEFTMPAPGLSH